MRAAGCLQTRQTVRLAAAAAAPAGVAGGAARPARRGGAMLRASQSRREARPP